MKNLNRTFLFLGAFGLLSVGSAYATPDSDTASADVGATVIKPIELTKTANLNFGQVVASASAGTVVLSPAGARSSTGGTTLGNETGMSVAAFAVAGEAAASYSVTLPAGPVTIDDGGDNDMTVDNFTSSLADETGTLDGSGNDTFDVGATLNVGADQAEGTYSGSFNVTVAYN